MPEILTSPVRIPVPGGKIIDEHIGLAANGEKAVSIAHMRAPAGWEEPAQTPEFDEYTVVFAGQLIVESEGEHIEVNAGQSVVTRAGERVRYRVGHSGAEYVAVCLPAFSPQAVNREAAE